MRRSRLGSPGPLPLVVALSLLGAMPQLASPGELDDAYANTYAKDFVMDAPWRVIDESTAIPITIVLKDCDIDDIRELHWIACWDVTNGGSTLLWRHDYDDERIGDDVWEENYWTYITTVTEGHPTLPNGTLLTPANLGYGQGDTIRLKVEVSYRDDWFNYAETRYLRVLVGGGPFPWPADWYGGDTHYHTMYTNNIAEYGAPIPAVRSTAAAMGLHWLTTTDHSCDLDETGDGSFSYATLYWEYSLQTPSGIATFYRDNVAHGSSWNALGADVGDFSDAELRIYRGTEVNLASIDGDSYDKTLHALFYNPSYLDSPLSGAIGERPVRPQLPDGLDQLDAMDGFAYAAHPLSDLAAEWGGFDWGVNGAVWGDEDLDVALQREAFRGLEVFNTRETRLSYDQDNPWSDFDAGVAPENPYPNELLEGITAWDDLLRRDLSSPRFRILLSGGSDAHGDFNYSTRFGLDSYATDNAIGKVQSVAYVPGGYVPGNLPPVAEIVLALREGRTVVTDGPFVEIGLDRDDDGNWYEDGDLMIGSSGTAHPDAPLPMKIRWASLPEFGPIVSVKLIMGDAGATTILHEVDPTLEGEGYGGETSVDLGGLGFDGPRYFRAECLTNDGEVGHRAYTNPIWIDFDATTAVAEPADARPQLGPAVPNPVEPFTEIVFFLPEPAVVGIEIYDSGGRRVRVLLEPGVRAEGSGSIRWDGRGETGERLAAGIYFCRLTAGNETRVRKLVLLGAGR